jgi:DNA-nicking Smr family endonuclease
MAEERDNDAEFALFRDAMRDVRRLNANNQVVRTTRPPAIPLQSRRDAAEALREMASGNFDYSNLEYGDEAFFQRPCVSRTDMRKLRRGQFSVQAELDLHGFALDDAKSALAAFIDHCTSRGMGCVRIIHGKGHRSPGKTPVLKPNVANWLSRWDAVNAFATARPVDGGTGALYVLLKF